MNIENPDLINAISKLTLNDIPYNRQKVYTAFLKSSFIIPTPEHVKEVGLVCVKEDMPIGLYTGKNSKGDPVLFVFTDDKSLLTWKSEGSNFIIMAASELLKFALYNNFASIVINPMGPTGMEITNAEMKILKEGTIVRDYDRDLNMSEVGVPQGMKVYIGAPAKKPSDSFIETCRHAAAVHKEIEEVYLYQVIFGKGEPHLVVGIYFSRRLEGVAVKEIISKMVNKLRHLIKADEYVDFVELKSDDTLQTVKKFVKPIFQKKYGVVTILKKKFLIIIWKGANKLCYPYLFIGNIKPKEINSIVDKLKLHFAVNLFNMHYHMDNSKNGSLLFAGKCYQSLGDHKIALEYFKKLWETDPYNLISFKEIGTECLTLEEYEEGLRYALKEVSQYPKNADSNAQLALLLLLSKRVDEAYNSIRRAKELDDKSSLVNDIYNFISEVKAGKKPIPTKLLADGRLP